VGFRSKLYIQNFLAGLIFLGAFLSSFSLSLAAQNSAKAVTCTASFYAKKFEGRKCSSGEIFSHSRYTAAHKTLPFGTVVRVTNIKNKKEVLVSINDRLPARSKRCIDLTRKAAMDLDFLQRGLARVRIEIVKDSIR
jgi:rare lipoprotein A